jgi:lipoprotein-anchoring transpeptidase ErfK/SrfK
LFYGLQKHRFDGHKRYITMRQPIFTLVSSRRFCAILIPVSMVLSACVPTPSTVSPTPGQPLALVEAPLAPAETAYLSRADGPHAIPAVPLEKLPTALRRQTIAFETTETPGTIVIHPGQKFLYFVTGRNEAIRYGISVGRAGFEWAGEAQVSEKKQWPTWTPPKEMIERDPKLSKWEKGQPGGPSNPLGARAIYLLTNGRDYGYRIHGTPDWWSIGRNASSGCIRMIHQDVIDLSQRVVLGSKVVVLNADGSYPKGLKLPPPAPVKKAVVIKPKATEVVTPVVAPVTPSALAPAPVDPAATTPVVAPGTTAPTVPETSTTVAPTTTVPAAVTAPAATVMTPVAPAPIVVVPPAPGAASPVVVVPGQTKTP